MSAIVANLKALYRMASASAIPTLDGKKLLKSKRIQAKFNDALSVMMELRTQAGIVDPAKTDLFFTVDYKKGKGISVGQHFYSTGQVLGPAFCRSVDVDVAILAVGEERIKNAFETLLFIGQ